MALRKTINELNEYDGNEKILTMYLNTDRAECQNGSWKIKLKNGLRRLEEYIVISGNDHELKQFKKLKKAVEKLLVNSSTRLQKGIVLFASNEDDLFSVHFLQVPIETEFYWEEKPQLKQLEKIQVSHGTSGVIVANEDELILMHSELGELVTMKQFTFEPDTEDWRLFEGTSVSERQARGANHRDHYQDRLEANQQRWLRGLLSKIEAEAVKNNWRHVHIIGQANYLALLEAELNLSIKSILRKTVPSNSHKDLIYKEIKAI